MAESSWKFESSPGHHSATGKVQRIAAPMTDRASSRRSARRVSLRPVVAIDTEAMGLNPHRDRLCLVQLSAGDGDAHLVQFAPGPLRGAAAEARCWPIPSVLKLFHFARFDLAMIDHYLGVMAPPVYCTKIASRLARTFTDRHGLRDLCKDLLERRAVEAAAELRLGGGDADRRAASLCRFGRASSARAARRLDAMLAREGREQLAAPASISCRIGSA